MTCRVGVWGLGWNYWRRIQTLLLMRDLGRIELVGLTARDLPAARTIDGMPVMAREELSALAPDVLVVMSSERFDEIASDAVGFGFAPESIMPCAFLETPLLDLAAWRELRADPPSIISNNAWGAAAVKTLRLESRSPLDEATIPCEDFLRLLADVEGHFAEGLQFAEMRYGRDGILHPWYALGDVLLGFELRVSCEEVERLWDERASLVRPERVFAAMTTHDRALERRFEELDGLRRCCFVPYESTCAHSLRVPVAEHDVWFSDVVVASAGRGPRGLAYDSLGLLAGRSADECVRTVGLSGDECVEP